MTDNIRPPHYRKGEIDLYESWYRTRPFSEFRAIMEAIAERYMKRDKSNRLEDIDIDPYDLMTLKASKIPAGAEGLLLLPFFTGERAPYWNSELRGMFFGLSLNHSRSHMIRAGMEGICFSLNCVLSALKDFGQVKDIRVSGSFTKSPLWLQIMADIFGEHITLPQNSEGAAFGAAVLGFIASGEMKDISDTANLIKPKKVYKPQAENKEIYEELLLQRL